MLLITVGLAFILELLAVISSYFRIDRPFDTSCAAMAMVAVCGFTLLSFSSYAFRSLLDVKTE